MGVGVGRHLSLIFNSITTTQEHVTSLNTLQSTCSKILYSIIVCHTWRRSKTFYNCRPHLSRYIMNIERSNLWAHITDTFLQ